MGITTDRHSECLHEMDESGMQKCYLVLSDEELGKGFVRAVRQSYIHSPSLGGCGGITFMNIKIAETYARDPRFYGGTFCGRCGDHFPVGINGEFHWVDNDGPTRELVGT